MCFSLFQQFRKNVLEVYYCQKTQFISAQKIIAHLDISVITVKVHGLTSISVSRFEGQCLIDFFPRITGRALRTISNQYDLVLVRPPSLRRSRTSYKVFLVFFHGTTRTVRVMTTPGSNLKIRVFPMVNVTDLFLNCFKKLF